MRARGLPVGGERDGASLRRGVLATAAAFLAWGALPVYWKALGQVRPAEILAHRVIWTTAAAACALTALGRWGGVRAALAARRDLLVVLAAGTFLGANWLTFIGAVAAGRVVECSLGYYINPLFNILLGYAVLGERFRPWQLAAIACASVGVINATATYGQVPWIALVLAGTFGVYGLLRKTARYGALAGLFMETAVLLVPAVVYLAAVGPRAWDAARLGDWRVGALLVGTGVVTGLPLVTFAYGARRIRLATVGFIQYLTPTGMFLLGVFAYREPFSTRHLITFLCIWIGLVVYSLDVVRRTRESRGP